MTKGFDYNLWRYEMCPLVEKFHCILHNVGTGSQVPREDTIHNFQRSVFGVFQYKYVTGRII